MLSTQLRTTQLISGNSFGQFKHIYLSSHKPVPHGKGLWKHGIQQIKIIFIIVIIVTVAVLLSTKL